MQIAIIIPNLHSPVIDKVISAVLSQANTLASIALEIWIVGQGDYSKIPTSAHIHLITTSEPLYPGAARNLGAQYAKADVFIFLDADCIPQSGWLSTLLEAWETHPDAGAVSGAMLPHSDTFIQHCGQIANFHEHLSLNSPGERQALASFSLLVPQIVWQQSGGFNPFLRHTEDLDFTLRLRKIGWKLYFEPKAQVYHLPTRNNWKEFWTYAFCSGMYSIQTRLRYNEVYAMPSWLQWAWIWRIGAPIIAFSRTLQIYSNTPHLWRYFYCLHYVFLHKLAWCYGAAKGLSQTYQGGSKI